MKDVFVRPYDLSGNVVIDAQNTRIISGIRLPNQTIAQLERENEIKKDELSPVTNIANNRFNFQNGINFVAIYDLIARSIRGDKPNKTKKRTKKVPKQTIEVVLREQLGEGFFNEDLGLAQDDINAFIFYAEDNGLDKGLLKKGNKLALIDFLYEQRNVYKQLKGR